MNFEMFWLTYPRKIGKATARKKYDQAIRKGFQMETLSKVLAGLETMFNLKEPSSNIPLTLQHGYIKNDGLMSLQPREQSITVEPARSAILWIQQLKSHRKQKKLWDERTQT